MGCPVFHLDVPGAVFDVAVVSVAEEDAVVGVGFAALGVGGDVVDFDHWAGVSQPGMMQPPSRARMTRFWWLVKTLWVLPSSVILPVGSVA